MAKSESLLPRRLHPFGFRLLLTICLLFIGLLQLGSTAELKYPSGIKPGDQVSGQEGEYFRYKHVLIKPPDDEDRRESILMGEDIRCEACEAMLHHMLKRADSFSEDHIMDQFEGELAEEVPLTDNAQDNRVNKNRKGCNKHFKDDLLLRGWRVRKCADVEQVSEARADSSRAWCLEQASGALPTERDVDTYNTRNEAAFYACENTVGRYGQEMAAMIVEKLEEEVPLADAISAACREAARCAGSASRKKSRKAKRKQKGSAEL